MTRRSLRGSILLLAAVALVLPAMTATPATAGTIGGGGGEMMGYRYELYLKREAEAQRKKDLAESEAGSLAGHGGGQKAGIGAPEFTEGTAITLPRRSAPTDSDDLDQYRRGK